MVKRIKAQHQRHGRQWLLGTVSALSLLATAHAKADQVTVKDGDTVWDLANQYQTSVNAIEDANPHVKKINSSVDLIYAGQQLELSKNSTVSQTSAVDSDSYTVKSGDTLSQISERLHVSLADLVSWNHLSNPDQLVIGQQLIVKGPVKRQLQPQQLKHQILLSAYQQRLMPVPSVKQSFRQHRLSQLNRPPQMVRIQTVMRHHRQVKPMNLQLL